MGETRRQGRKSQRFRAGLVLVGALSFVAGFVQANRLTRGDVTLGGATRDTSGSGDILYGSAGSIEMPAGEAGDRLHGGLQANLHHPPPPTQLKTVPLSVSSTSIQLNWVTPGAGVLLNKPVGIYQLRRNTGSPITETNFDNGTNIPFTPQVLSPGNTHPNVTISGLNYDTVYHFGLAALDNEWTKNRSLVAVTSTCTLAPAPTDLSAVANYDDKSITVSFHPNNPLNHSLFFEGRVSKFDNFQTLVSTRMKTSDNATSVTLPSFTGYSDRNSTYYYQVRALNQAGVWTEWHPATPASVNFPNAIPTIAMAPEDVFITSATLRWTTVGLPSNNTFVAEASTNNFTTVLSSSSYLPVAAPFHPFTGLRANTPHQFRVKVFDSGFVEQGVTDAVERVTNVFGATGVQAMAVYESSATIVWNDDRGETGNGTSMHSFVVEHSTVSESAGWVVRGTVTFPPDILPRLVLTGLPVNAANYVRVLTKNSAGAPSPQGYSPGDTFHTLARQPGAITLLPPTDPRHQIQFTWTHNGNNPQTRYRVELARDDSFAAVLDSSSLAPGVTTHTFQNTNPAMPGVPVLSNATHFVRVRTIQSADGVPLPPGVSGITITAPLPPAIDSVVPAQRNMTVAWSGQSGVMRNADETPYQIQWLHYVNRTAEGAYGPATAPPWSAQSTNLLTHNTRYEIVLWSKKAAGSPYSDISTTTVTVTLAAQPTFNYTEADIHQSSITARWSSQGNPDGTRYEVKISTSNGFEVSITSAGTTTQQFWPFTNLVPNRRYFLRVQAYNDNDVASGYHVNGERLSYTRPSTPSVLPFVKEHDGDFSKLILRWDQNGNDPATIYYTRMDVPGYTEVGPFYSQLFQNLLPNTPHTFQVRAEAVDTVNHTLSATTTTYTWAQPAPTVTFGNVTDVDTWEFIVDPGANPPNTTEYAFQLKKAPTLGSSIYDNKFLVYNPFTNAAETSSVTDINDPRVWRVLPDWGFQQNGRYVIQGDLLPSEQHEIWVYVRNGNREVELPSKTPIIPQAGPPVVKLTWNGTEYTPAESASVPFFVNQTQLAFRATGSSHFNFIVSSNPNDIDRLSAQFATASDSKGWNGQIDDTGPCSDETPPVSPPYAGPIKGVCVAGEGLYYFHIVGNVMNTGTPVGPSYKGIPSFGFNVDLTAPVAGDVAARAQGFDIVSGGDTLGFQVLDFSWPVIDGGNAESRSPIEGWAYSLHLNNADAEPARDTTGRFVTGPAIQLDLTSATGSGGLIPSTGIYFFKVIGLDKAGNWQSTPTTFVYKFKEDSTPPAFLGVSLAGAKMPKRDFQYAAVAPVEPIRILFSEPMNFSQAAGGIKFIQTHNAQGRIVPPAPVCYTAHVEMVPSTAMLVTAALQPGSRYELESTPNLRDRGGNKLPGDQQFRIVIFTQIDPGVRTLVVTEDGQTQVEISAGALGTKPSGVAFDGDVANDTQPLGARVRRASGAMSRRLGGDYNQVLSSKEFNHYLPDGTLVRNPFIGPVRLTFRYNDSNNDGIVDESVDTHPVKVDRLSVHVLDERSGAWIKMPGSQVDTHAKEVSVDLRCFSVYALVGTVSFELTEAHPFPVPYRAKEHRDGIIFSFPNAQVATVKVFTLDGRLVKTLSDDSGAGFVRWDPVANESGEPVASDVYSYVIENDQQRRVGKLMVIR